MGKGREWGMEGKGNLKHLSFANLRARCYPLLTLKVKTPSKLRARQ